MKIRNILATLLLMTFGGIARASDCPVPTGDKKLFFDLVNAPKTTGADLTQFLGSHNVSDKALDEDCRSPYMNALDREDPQVFQSLFSFYNPDLNAVLNPDLNCLSIYTYALASSSREVLNAVKSDASSSNKYLTMMPYASCASSKNRLMLDEFGLVSIENSHLDVVQDYLRAGGNVNASYGKGYSLLTLAAGNNSAEVVDFLIRSGAVAVPNPETFLWTPLHVAIFLNNNPKVVKVLIGAGFDVNAKSSVGETPLIMAGYGPLETVELLLAAGAHVNDMSQTGSTAVSNSGYNDDPEVAKALLSAGANVNTHGSESALFNAVIFRHAELVDIFIHAGADVNDGQFSSPLMESVGYDFWDKDPNINIVYSLVTAGAKINGADANKKTPLMYAIEPRSNKEYKEGVQIPIIRFLIGAGADLSAKDQEGLTALERAKVANAPESFIKLLGGSKN